MKEIAIGLISGIIGGLGMGGGTVLILLAIFIFIKNKNIQFKIGLPVCLWGLVGALIGAVISTRMEVGILRKCFGVFLILIAIYQTYSFYKRYRKEKNRNNSIK